MAFEGCIVCVYDQGDKVFFRGVKLFVNGLTVPAKDEEEPLQDLEEEEFADAEAPDDFDGPGSDGGED